MEGDFCMADDKMEIGIPGKFSPEEEAILDHLYNHPDEMIGTGTLIGTLKPDQEATEKRQQSYEEIQGAIETLVAQGLAKGKRVSISGRVCFEKLRLTPRGEVAAIKERKRVKKLVFIDISKESG
jgi:hypothetical protein